MRWNNPAGVTGYGVTLVRASDKKDLKAYAANPVVPVNSFSFTAADGVVAGVAYYAKVRVRTDTFGPDATSPQTQAVAAAGLPGQRTYGCACQSSTGRSGGLMGYSGDPVNLATGAWSEQYLDASVAAPGRTFKLSRVYTSLDATGGRLGTGWTSVLDVALQSITATGLTYRAESGEQVAFTKAANGVWSAPPGARLTLAQSATGYDLTTADREVYHFATNGALQTVKDRTGQGLTLARESHGWVSKVTDAAGQVTNVAYNADASKITVTFPDTRTVAYELTGGKLTRVVGRDGGATQYGYDAGNRVTTVTDPTGRVIVTNLYDATTHRVKSQTDAAGKVTDYWWDAATRWADVFDSTGYIVSENYSAGNVLLRRLDALGKTEIFRYDARMNLIERQDQAQRITRYAYDSRDNQISKTTPAGLVTTTTYDASDQVTSVTDPLKHVTKNTYTPQGQLATVTNAAGGITKLTYTANGQVATRTTPSGRVTTYTYDGVGNLSAETSPGGRRTTYTYDTAGRRASIVDPRGNATDGEPERFRTSFTYDGGDRTTSVTDPLGRVTRSEYDAAGRRTADIDASGRKTTYEY